MTKQPFMPLFVGDFLASTFTWSGEEQSLYLLLLAYQWGSGPLPNDVKKLARAVRYEERTFRKLWPTISEKFPQTEGGIANPRLEQHRDKANAIAEKNRASGRVGAAARWRNDGERHSERHSERHESANGGPLCHPNHTILNPKSPPTPRKRGEPAKPRKTTIPNDFTPDLAYASTHLPDVDAAALAELFASQAAAKGWEYADWSRAWQTYVRNSAPASGHFAAGQYPRRVAAEPNSPDTPAVLPGGEPNPVVVVAGKRVRQYILGPNGQVGTNPAAVQW